MRFYRLLLAVAWFASITFSAVAQQGKTDSLENALKKANKESQRIVLLNELANVYASSVPDKAIDYASRALNLSRKTGNKVGKGAAYNWLGAAFRTKGDFAQALVYYDKCLSAYEEAGEKLSMAAALNNIGNVYLDQGNYDKGYEKFLASLEIFSKAGNKERVAIALANIGVMFQNKASSTHNMHDYELALKYHKQSYELDKELKDEYNLSIDLNNLGSVYSDMGKMRPDAGIFKKALAYFEEALSLKERVEDIYGKAIVLVNMGDAYIQYGKIIRKPEMQTTAVYYAKKSLIIFTEIGDPYGMAYACNKIGQAFAEKNHIHPNPNLADSSLHYMNQGLRLAQEINAKDILKELYSGLSVVYEMKNNYRESLKFERLFSSIKDSMLNAESARSMNEMETKYETAEKDKALLLKDVEINRQQAEARQKATQRNAFIVGFGLVFVLSAFIFRGYRQKRRAHLVITRQKQEVEHQKDVIEEKNKDITDSINYARRIQRTMITAESFFSSHLREFFVLYKPKDIVSGDFYWGTITADNTVLLATADCTGHGVPGAFMSMVGISKLHEIVVEKKISQPAEILNRLRDEVIRALNPEGAEEESKDGMDISLCAFELATLKLEYANANNSIYHVCNGNLTEYKADKMPVGKYNEEVKSFTHKQIQLQPDDMIYTFTDGYADQFGGPKGKKFKYKQLEELLVSVYRKPLDEQKAILETSLQNWKGDAEQVDDILIIGIRI